MKGWMPLKFKAVAEKLDHRLGWNQTLKVSPWNSFGNSEQILSQWKALITVGVTDENINAPNFDFYIGEDQVQNIPEGTLQEDDEDKSIVKLRTVFDHVFRTFFEFEYGPLRKFPTGSLRPEIPDRKFQTGSPRPEVPDVENWKRATDLDFTIPNTRTCFEIINAVGTQCQNENLELKASDYFSVIATKETIDLFLLNYLETSSDGSMV